MFDKKRIQHLLKKIWQFIWEDNSLWSWIVNIIIAFVLTKFVIYPILSLILGTGYPVVAVVSSSMEHKIEFDKWWENNQEWYVNNGITKEKFIAFPMRNGFNKGDIIVLLGKEPKDIKIGDIIIFKTGKREPIIHRLVKKYQTGGDYVFSTKGDNNLGQLRSGLVDETNIHQSQVIGTAYFKIPLLGYVKILSINAVCSVSKFSFCINGI